MWFISFIVNKKITNEIMPELNKYMKLQEYGCENESRINLINFRNISLFASYIFFSCKNNLMKLFSLLNQFYTLVSSIECSFCGCQ